MSDQSKVNGFFGPLFDGDPPSSRIVPCIKISFMDHAWHVGEKIKPRVVMRDVVAMLDTGADSLFFDKSLRKALDLQPMRSGILKGIYEEEETKSYRTVYGVDGTDWIYIDEMVERDFSHNAFKVILGWRFLSKWKLFFDQPGDHVHLTK